MACTRTARFYPALLLILFIGISGPSPAQALRASDGDSIGWIEGDGTVRNASGNVIGRIDEDGTVRNDAGNVVGRLDGNGNVRNDADNGIGWIESDGTVRNASGNVIGRIDENGTVRNDAGDSIGNAAGGKRAWAALVFFFFDEARLTANEGSPDLDDER